MLTIRAILQWRRFTLKSCQHHDSQARRLNAVLIGFKIWSNTLTQIEEEVLASNQLLFHTTRTFVPMVDQSLV